MAGRLRIGLVAGLAGLACAAPALADVKDGVDAWSRGDWDAAVAEWRGPAEAGDPDALFNMGQAYRLGRGVPQDQQAAEAHYLRAAQEGHLQAADTYGLLLFQEGRREEALPFVEDAARRGDPRAQYLLGIAHFNGDIVARDWVRAYALLTLANGQGLPQAAPALAQMDQHIPLDERQQAASLAVELQREADATRAREMAAADLAMESAWSAQAQPDASPPPAPVRPSGARVPRPIASVDVEPSVFEAQEAARAALSATGTEDPGEAGADYARPASAQVTHFTLERTPRPAAPPQPAEAPPAQPPAPAARASGAWKVQLGAFSVRGNAERLWSDLQARPEFAGRTPLLVAAGRLTKLQVGGYATRAEAQAVCAALARSGQACIATQ